MLPTSDLPTADPSPEPSPPRRTLRVVVGSLVALGCLGGGLAAVLSSGGAAASGAHGPTAVADQRSLQVTDTEAGSLARADTTTVLYDGTGGRPGGGPAGADPTVQAQGEGEATVADIDPEPDADTTTTTLAPSPPMTQSTVPSGPVIGIDLDADQTSDPNADPSVTPDDGTSTTPPADQDDAATGAPSATLTELLPIGSTADRGSVLYRADAEPIVALIATTPLFRDLSNGVDDGPDVQALETNLVALGHGSGVTVDEHFDAGTAAAVTRWEEALGRVSPDGAVAVGEVVYLDEPTAVLGHEVAVGDLLEAGDAVLVLGAESRIVNTDVTADRVGDWPVGTEVELRWGDDTTSPGTVTEVSRDESDGEIAIVITIADGGGNDRPIGSSVEVLRTVAERTDVVAVPVSAVVSGPDGPSVRVAGTGEDRVVPVELGIVAGGWVEVRKGIDADTRVRLPGS